jgi:hypothetical protein
MMLTRARTFSRARTLPALCCVLLALSGCDPAARAQALALQHLQVRTGDLAG